MEGGGFRKKNGTYLRETMVIPGYRRFNFSDFTLFLHEDFVQSARALYRVLSSLASGDIDPRSVEPFSNGRTVVYLTHTEGKGDLVIRPYLHGGAFGRILKGRFFSPQRFFEELKITIMARKAGVTLLNPVCVTYRKTGWGVSGFWISRRIPRGESLYDWMRSYSPSMAIIKRTAQAVARMHINGIGHSDLTVQNILVVPSSGSLPAISIIDFDKAYKRDILSLRDRIQQIRRLDRSLLKWTPKGSPWRTPWVRLRFAAAYCGLIPEIRPLIRDYIRHFRRYESWYRLGWALRRVIG